MTLFCTSLLCPRMFVASVEPISGKHALNELLYSEGFCSIDILAVSLHHLARGYI